jgi:hypothetical protein
VYSRQSFKSSIAGELQVSSERKGNINAQKTMYKQMRYDLAKNLFVKLVLIVRVQNLLKPRLNHAAG